jgi:hypothetical protein
LILCRQFRRAFYAKLYGSVRRVNLKIWLYILPDPVPGAEITSVSSSGNRKATCDRSEVVAPTVVTKSTGRSFQVMAQSAIDKIPPGPKLDALTAEKVFGWKNVHKHTDRGGALYGKRQDKAGHWRLAKVPPYSTNPLHSYSVENRMKQLGRLDRYQKELAKITHAEDIPSDWASPEQRCRAAIKAVGQYGKVIPLSKLGG